MKQIIARWILMAFVIAASSVSVSLGAGAVALLVWAIANV